MTKQNPETAELLRLLRQHHDWHLQSGTIGLQDGEGGWVEIDNAAEYSDSLMYERTEKALAGLPPDEAGPMPRGGVQAWWWSVAVRERRNRRALETAIERAHRWLTDSAPTLERRVFQATGILAHTFGKKDRAKELGRFVMAACRRTSLPPRE